jgi:hypothetical protein
MTLCAGIALDLILIPFGKSRKIGAKFLHWDGFTKQQVQDACRRIAGSLGPEDVLNFRIRQLMTYISRLRVCCVCLLSVFSNQIKLDQKRVHRKFHKQKLTTNRNIIFATQK